MSEGELCRGKDRTEDSKGGGWTDETSRRVKYCLAKIGTQTSGRQTQTAVSGRADPRRDNDAGQTTIGQDGMPAAYKSPHTSRPRHRRSCRDPIMPPPSPDQVAPRDIQGPPKDHPGGITPRAPPPIRTAPGKKLSMPIRRCTTDTTSLSGTGRCTASVAQRFSHGRAGRGAKYARGSSPSRASFSPLASPFHLLSSNHQTSHSNRPSPNPQTETPTRRRTIKAHKTPRQRETDEEKNKGQKGPAPVQPRLLQLRGCIRQVRGRQGGWAI